MGKEQEIKKENKALKIAERVIGTIIAVIAVILILFGAGEKIVFASFYANATQQMKTPGVSDGFVQQGLDYLEDKDLYLSCGYMKKSSKASRIYIFDKKGNSSFIELWNEDGTPYTGHTGGIAHYGDYVYITADDGLDVFSLKTTLSGCTGVKKIGEIKTYNNPAYCHIYNGMIYVGSFYRAGNYETPESERITTPAGDENKAIITVFELNKDEEFGVKKDVKAVYSTTGLVQGMCITDDSRLVLSTSYGLAASHLYVYDIARATKGEYEINETTVPIYYFDSACLLDTIKAPPMSEEILYENGKILIITESASNKYIFGKFTTGKHLFAYKLDK